jgi:hypothetical protein
MTEHDKFYEWMNKRGVWPRVTYEEIWLAGREELMKELMGQESPEALSAVIEYAPGITGDRK